MAADPQHLELEDEFEDEEEDFLEELDADAAAELAAEAAEEMANQIAAQAGGMDIEDPEDEYEEEYETDEGGVENGDEEAGEEEEEEESEDEQAQDWTGLKTLPERELVVDLLGGAQAAGRKDLTVLLLGKSGVGKSSLVNSLLGEKAAAVSAFKLQADTESSTTFSRQVALGVDLDGFKLRLIDTCGLEDPEAGDTINYMALQRIAEDIRGKPIDVVLYCDRLDLYRVEPLDKRMMQAISDQFGRQIWSKTVLVLTHGNMAYPPPGTNYDDFSSKRIQLLQRAIRRPFFKPALPAAIAENSDTCKVDAERYRVLPNGEQWVPELVETLVDVALATGPYRWRAGLARKPNKRFKWLMPFVCYAQYMAWKMLLEPRLQHDRDVQARLDEETWQDKATERRRLGIGPPLRPDEKNAWRLEQMYEDD